MSAANIQDDIDIARAIRLQTYLNIMGLSFLFYDHLFVTLGAEISLIWTRPKSASSYWFFLNRYIAFFGNIAVLVFGFNTLPSRRFHCEPYNSFRQALLVVNQGLICVLSVIRTYALYALSVRILIFMLTSAAALLSVAIWGLTAQSTSLDHQLPGCHVDISTESGIYLAVIWEALFAYDAIIFILTLLRTYKTRSHETLISNPDDLTSLLLRDGAVYFAVMAFANLANILTFYMAGPLLKGGLSAFASSISVTMMSRLMLNLHETTGRGTLGDTHTSMIFTRSLSMMEPSGMDDASPSLEEENLAVSSGIELQELALGNSNLS